MTFYALQEKESKQKRIRYKRKMMEAGEKFRELLLNQLESSKKRLRPMHARMQRRSAERALHNVENKLPFFVYMWFLTPKKIEER